jgi:hypothetical protein
MDSELATPINKMTDSEMKQELEDNGVTLHHKTGSKKLASTLEDVRNGKYENIISEEEAVTIEDRPYEGGLPGASKAAIEAATKAQIETPDQKAMKLSRVVVTPNDPNMTSYPGLIFTVGSSKINNGRMIKKFVPFNNEEGWHVPKIIIDQIENAEMQKFKTITTPNGEKVLEPYLTKKFNVRVLPPLTKQEMDALAASQQAAGFNVGA